MTYCLNRTWKSSADAGYPEAYNHQAHTFALTKQATTLTLLTALLAPLMVLSSIMMRIVAVISIIL